MEELKAERPDMNKLSIRDLFFKYIRFLPLFILCIGLAVLGAWLYLRYAGERYASIGSMLIETGSGSEDKVEDLISARRAGKNLQNEIEVLKSRPLLARVVENNNLEYSYTSHGNIKDKDVYKMAPFTLEPLQLNDSNLIFSIPVEFINRSQFRINNENTNYNFGQAFKTGYGVFKLVKEGEAAPGSKFTVSYTPAPIRAAQLSPAINIQPKIQGTGILTVQYETTNPFLAADVINALMQEYNVNSIEQTNLSMDQTIGFVDRRLAVLQRDIDSLTRKLLQYQKSNDIVNTEAQISDLMQKSSAQDEVILERSIGLSSLNQLEGYLRNNANSRTVAPSALGIDDATLNTMIGKYNEAQLERKSLIESNIPADNPRIKEAEENIEILRRSTLENIRMLKANYQKNISIASAEKSKSRGTALQMPTIANEQVELERQLQSKLTLFKLLDQKKEEAAISRSSTQPISRIIELAQPINAPVKPQPNTIYLTAIFIGLALPTLFVFLKEMLNDKINTRGDIEKVTEAPILGEVGHSFADKTLIVNKTNRSLIAEQFRILRSNLQYIIGKKDQATILVTSSFGGEGKSFISTNMAAVLALTDKKTVVLEFDLRKPRVLAGLNMNSRPGISNFMVGNKNLDELLIKLEDNDNLFILPCGPIPPNPSELLLGERMDELFNKLKQKFDYIVIDTAPVGMVSDALTLGKYADCTLYVSRQGHTFKKQIGLIDEMYTTKKLPHLSIVLNDVKMPTGGGYYGNYGYGYYGYGEKSRNSYYEDEIRPEKKFGEKVMDALNPLTWFSRKN